MKDFEIVEANITVNKDTFAPELIVTARMNLSIEPMMDSMAQHGTRDKVCLGIGNSILNALLEYDKHIYSWLKDKE